jgi:hypothetical protein
MFGFNATFLAATTAGRHRLHAGKPYERARKNNE